MATDSERFAGVLDVPLHAALGLEFIDPERPQLGVRLEVSELAGNNVGILHGGLTAALLDVAAYLAVVPSLDPDANAVTHSTACSLQRGVDVGEVVEFSGTLLRRTRSLAFCSSEARREGEIVASGQLVKSIVAGVG